MNEQQAVTTTKAPVAAGPRGVILADLDAMWRFSSAVAKSGLAPKGIQSPEAIFIAIQMGAECGLPPMASLQNIAVINGRPALWGDAQLAVVRGTGELEAFAEWFEVGGKKVTRPPAELPDSLSAVCQVKRRGYPAAEQSFSVADAKRAGLWGKESPWKYYPTRMLQMRARAFVLRDQFGDALRGMRSAEELHGPTIDVEAVTDPEPAVKLFSAPEAVTITHIAAPQPEPVQEPVAAPEQQVEQKVAAPEPKPSAQAEPTPQERLMLYLADYEIGFDDFTTWALKSGQTDKAWETWDAIPTETAMRLYAGRKPMANSIKAAKGAK